MLLFEDTCSNSRKCSISRDISLLILKFLLIELIPVATQFHYDHNMPVSIHWVPSHIEQTVYGRIPIEGNIRADKLAEVARRIPTMMTPKTKLNILDIKFKKASQAFSEEQSVCSLQTTKLTLALMARLCIEMTSMTKSMPLTMFVAVAY